MNLLFDLDGTLTNPFQGITRCIQHALTAHGYAVPSQADLAWCIGPNLKDSFRTLTGSQVDEKLNAVLASYRERFGRVGLFENELYPEIPSVLQALQIKRCQLFVCTSKPQYFAKQITDHFHLTKYFKVVYGAGLDGAHAQKGDLIAHILQTEHLDVKDCVMIGDRKEDIIGAQANAMQSIGVLWGFGSREELANAKASRIIDHPDQLLTLV